MLTDPNGNPTPPQPDPDVIVNQNGLLFNVTRGHFTGYAPIPISDAPGINAKRKVVAATFHRDPDFELTITLTIDYFNPDGTHFLTAELAVEADSRRRSVMQQQFAPYQYSRTTRDSYLDPATGSTRTATNVPVTPANTPGAIPELAWFQSLNAASLAGLGIDTTGMTYEVIDYVVTIALVMQMDGRGQL